MPGGDLFNSSNALSQPFHTSCFNLSNQIRRSIKLLKLLQLPFTQLGPKKYCATWICFYVSNNFLQTILWREQYKLKLIIQGLKNLRILKFLNVFLNYKHNLLTDNCLIMQVIIQFRSSSAIQCVFINLSIYRVRSKTRLFPTLRSWIYIPAASLDFHILGASSSLLNKGTRYLIMEAGSTQK